MQLLLPPFLSSSSFYSFLPSWKFCIFSYSPVYSAETLHQVNSSTRIAFLWCEYRLGSLKIWVAVFTLKSLNLFIHLSITYLFISYFPYKADIQEAYIGMTIVVVCNQLLSWLIDVALVEIFKISFLYMCTHRIIYLSPLK